MPDLIHTFLKYDIGLIRIIAASWGLELESLDLDSAAEELSASVLDLETVTETIDILSPQTRSALGALLESNGKMEWVAFSRKYGDIREMGEARRERERPHLKPISPAENLFYRGLLAKAFFDTDKGAQEFAYIPDDLLELIRFEMSEAPRITTSEPPGRPATPVEKAFAIPATDHILDDATTWLAALRMGKTEPKPQAGLRELLIAAGIIANDEPQTETVKFFLEDSRTGALKSLIEAWKASPTYDELRLIPGLLCEGEWTNQPQVTREFLLDLIGAIPQNKWWSIPAFVRAIKEKFPDFQRPAGDYDSWFIKRESDGQYLRGFAYWDSVDGALVKHFIHTLHWLGMADLAAPEEGREATAFRTIGLKVEGSQVEEKMTVSSNGRITLSRYFSRAARYQISRFCEWVDSTTQKDEYKYQVTAQSLTHAKGQGLKAEQLLSLLVRHTNGNVPPALVKALKQWEAHGTEARVESLLVLRVSRPEVMEEMRKSKAAKFLGEVLSPTAVVVKQGAESNVLSALAELGLLAEVNIHE
ncbi:MAG: helicase-associated domain-containing protein [Chloroflexi bacterium]|nr:helicase-associated domain-containing protein [Chloroflexota bacterium]